ncbi:MULTISPECIES: hypothetical protein [Stenotrophomonas]|jgi:hypothetical protein|uniref:hypothetical protein n=1 Tax=Stenotrophomonas TaxID=40323 RepID=UPI0013DCDB6D|nr:MULTISPECIES: hypothetical protein [Stenotrophomonas]HEL7615154.1 hypothetical protein [Stenotrophomonas maltophilia]HEL7762212.1 hypothetical protein [Stenotrophomonas maltophilia]
MRNGTESRLEFITGHLPGMHYFEDPNQAGQALIDVCKVDAVTTEAVHPSGPGAAVAAVIYVSIADAC